MEITLGNRTYKSGKAKLKTVKKLVQLSETIREREAVAQGDDVDAQAKLIATIHPVMELDANIALIVEYFNHQFTAEQFLDGYKVDTMQDFALLMYQLIAEAVWGITIPVTEKK